MGPLRRQKKLIFRTFLKTCSLEVQNETCSLILCLLGYIAYGVHLCNKILIFQGAPQNGTARHPVLWRSLPVSLDQADMALN